MFFEKYNYKFLFLLFNDQQKMVKEFGPKFPSNSGTFSSNF